MIRTVAGLLDSPQPSERSTKGSSARNYRHRHLGVMARVRNWHAASGARGRMHPNRRHPGAASPVQLEALTVLEETIHL